MPIYTNAQYANDPITGIVISISVDINGMPSFVPIDPANTDYSNIMQLVESGDLIIKPADGVNQQ
jgi:hypothetical protein